MQSTHRERLELVHQSESNYLVNMIDNKCTDEELKAKARVFQDIRDILQTFNNFTNQINCL